MTKKSKTVKHERKPIGRRLRFEVFKRDRFTCQYCGRKAPDVVLHVDHLKPVAEGGDNDIMNLVTSCVDCNLGKGARPLSEDSMVAKQRAQAELLAERREQIEMLRDWHLELARQDNMEVEVVAEYFKALTGGRLGLTDAYKMGVALPLVKRFGVEGVIGAMQEGLGGYRGDVEKMLSKLGGICAVRSDSHLRHRVRIVNGLASHRYPDFDRKEASYWVKIGWNVGGYDFIGEMEPIAEKATRRTWKEEVLVISNIITRMAHEYPEE